MARWNGKQWSLESSGTTDSLYDSYGSDENNVGPLEARQDLEVEWRCAWSSYSTYSTNSNPMLREYGALVLTMFWGGTIPRDGTALASGTTRPVWGVMERLQRHDAPVGRQSRIHRGASTSVTLHGGGSAANNVWVAVGMTAPFCTGMVAHGCSPQPVPSPSRVWGTDANNVWGRWGRRHHSALEWQHTVVL